MLMAMASRGIASAESSYNDFLVAYTGRRGGAMGVAFDSPPTAKLKFREYGENARVPKA